MYGNGMVEWFIEVGKTPITLPLFPGAKSKPDCCRFWWIVFEELIFIWTDTGEFYIYLFSQVLGLTTFRNKNKLTEGSCVIMKEWLNDSSKWGKHPSLYHSFLVQSQNLTATTRCRFWWIVFEESIFIWTDKVEFYIYLFSQVLGLTTFRNKNKLTEGSCRTEWLNDSSKWGKHPSLYHSFLVQSQNLTATTRCRFWWIVFEELIFIWTDRAYRGILYLFVFWSSRTDHVSKQKQAHGRHLCYHDKAVARVIQVNSLSSNNMNNSTPNRKLAWFVCYRESINTFFWGGGNMITLKGIFWFSERLLLKKKKKHTHKNLLSSLWPHSGVGGSQSGPHHCLYQASSRGGR